MKLAELLRKAASEVHAYQNALEYTLYGSYSVAELAKKLRELGDLEVQLEVLADSEPVIIQEVMED